MKNMIKCKECGSCGTIAIDLFHSGYLVARDNGDVDIVENEDKPEANNIAMCYACGKEYTASEWAGLVVPFSERKETDETNN